MATKKRTTSKKNSSRKRSKKVYISAKNVFAICIIVVIVSFGLLLITNKDSSIPNVNLNLPSISQRFIQESTEQKSKPKTQDNNQNDNQQAKENTKTKESVKTTETKKQDNIQPKESTKEKQTPSTKEEVKVPIIPSTKKETQVQQEQKKPTYDFPPAQNNAQLIFVFDDAGQNNNHLEKFLKLPFDFTVAVLPKLPLSKQAANKIRSSGKEVILHQPMQALNQNTKPGPGAITPQMDENQIISTLYSNIDDLSPIAGINNHEGSAITSDSLKMETILKLTAENSLYFLDSRTTSETKIPYVSNALGFSWFERNIFLDNIKTKTNAYNELKKGLALANKNGSVIMIGHIWSADFLPDFLQEVYPLLKEKGYSFSVVSKSKARKY